MNENAARQPPGPDELQVLTFTLRGVKMGIDTCQIVELMEPDEAEARGWKPFRLSDRLALRGANAAEHSAKVLLTGKEGTPMAVTIDRPAAILSIPLDDLQPLPRLIASCGGSRAVWGAVVREDELILLVDLYKLPAVKTRTEDRPDLNRSPANFKEET
jgi:chemotaxis signal transduction protein